MNSTCDLAQGPHLDIRITRRRVLAYHCASTGNLFEAALLQGHKARAKSGAVPMGTTRIPAATPMLRKPVWQAVEVRWGRPDHATQKKVFEVLDEHMLGMGYEDQRERGYACVWYQWEGNYEATKLTIFSPDEDALMAIRLAL